MENSTNYPVWKNLPIHSKDHSDLQLYNSINQLLSSRRRSFQWFQWQSCHTSGSVAVLKKERANQLSELFSENGNIWAHANIYSVFCSCAKEYNTKYHLKPYMYKYIMYLHYISYTMLKLHELALLYKTCTFYHNTVTLDNLITVDLFTTLLFAC